MNKKNLIVFGLVFGIMLFFIGLASYIALGPSTDAYLLPKQVSAVLKLSGMGLVVIGMIVGGFFVDEFDKESRTLLLIFGIIFLIVNIFIISYA
ncbi:MAG: hypothetical protein KKC68_07270 [Candidatus Thermoplasmatota archaeon]|nr:hypothetical protein [Candidatus Thermoplasmatota archaeon]MBU1941559.1 hypothetical protein [Candidatus Thermoplasmatota archaeon]